MLKCIGIVGETAFHPIQNFGMWNVEMIPIPIPIPEFWNVELECGDFHSTFHIPMHFSMVGMRYSQKDNSTFHIPKFWNGNWNVEFPFHIPHSNAL